MKNTTLKAQLEALHDIGLDRVNAAIAATGLYIVQIEDALEQHILAARPSEDATIADLTQQNTLLRAELAAVYKAVQDPTPADAVPSPTPGFVGDPPGGSPGSV